MPMSLKCMIGKWLHKGQISQEEYDAVIKKLNGHDKQIRADVKAEYESADIPIIHGKEELAEHDKQIRNDAIKEYHLKLLNCKTDKVKSIHDAEIWVEFKRQSTRIAEQLKGAENEHNNISSSAVDVKKDNSNMC